MKIVGIETSCDDTTIGIIQEDTILINKKITHGEMLKKYGGVVPEVAARNHVDLLDILMKNSLEECNLQLKDIDVISSTIGPGMIGGLIVGNSFARTLAQLNDKIFIPVHHLEAHILVSGKDFPFLAVVISGGHTVIVLCKSFMNYEIISNSLDDACGEFFDKLAKEMNLPFPGGPYLEKIALESDIICPINIPMAGKVDFSFSGIKTEFKKLINKYPKETIAFWMQDLVAKILCEKINIAIQKTNIQSIVVCGGVASNKHIRKKLQQFQVCFPPIELCTDNGVMVAMAAKMHVLNNSPMVNNFKINEFPRMNLDLWCR